MQVAVSHRRRLDPADDPLEPEVGVVEDDLDRPHAFGSSPGDCPTATDKLGQVRPQRGLQVLPQACDEAAAFARRQAQSCVRTDGKFDTAADDLAVAAGMCPVTAPLGQRMTGLRGWWRWGSEVTRVGSSARVDVTAVVALLVHDAVTLTRSAGQAPASFPDTFRPRRT